MADIPLPLGRMVRLRRGPEVVETLDTVRFAHLLQFARGTGKVWPTLEQVAKDQDGQGEVDAEALVAELQKLAQERPPEDVAPLIGLLRNDAVRVTNFARAHGSG